MLRTILLAYDGSEDSEDALSLALDLMGGLRAAMHIAAVLDAGSEPTRMDVEADRRHAWQRLREAEDLAARQGLSVRLEVLEGEPAAEIVAHSRRVGADVIVLGHGRHGRLDRWTGASVAARVLEHAPCAVLMPPVKAFRRS